MANSLIGKIVYVQPTQNVETRNGAFQKREVWLSVMRFDGDTGEPIFSDDSSRAVSIEFTRNKCIEVDSFKEGDEVVVPIRVRGNVYEKDGITRCINTIEGIGISAYQRGASIVVNEAPQHQEQSQQVQQPIQQPAFQQPMAPQFAQPMQQYYPQPQPVNPNGNGVAPF